MSPDNPNVPSNLPSHPLDRTALERVLARAAELQGGESDLAEPTLTEQQIVELGKEVGLSEAHLRVALAEERTGTRGAPERGLAVRLAGPSVVSASRTVRGTAARVLAELDTWMQREECLQVKRQFPDRVVWEARRDLVGSIKRGFNIGGRGYHLSKAQEVSGTVVAIDPERVLVRLDADLSPQRSNVLGGAAVPAVVGGGTSTLFVAAIATGAIPIVAPFAALAVIGSLLPAALGGGAALAVARTYRRTLQRTQLALEQVLDRLEHGAPRGPANPVLDIISGVSRLKP